MNLCTVPEYLIDMIAYLQREEDRAIEPEDQKKFRYARECMNDMLTEFDAGRVR